MKKLSVLLVSVFIILFLNCSFSQEKEAENTYEITGKAKKGALANVEYDGTKYQLTYITKSTDTKIKMQHYFFDNDFKFIEMIDEIEEIEKVKTKYEWFEWNGELYSIEGNYVQPNLTGTLILKKKKITYKYDWILLGYYKTIEILEKVKPKTDDGRKFFYLSHGEDDKTGDLYILCGIKGSLKDVKKDKSLAYRHQKDFVILKFNNHLELVKETPVKFDYLQHVAYSTIIPSLSSNCDIEGMAFVFAPMGGQGMNKYADPEMKNYTYLRIDKDLNIIDNIKFKSQQTYWRIEQMVHNKADNSIYLFGPSALGKDKYYNLLTSLQKFKSVQLMKIAKNKVEYLTETDLSEFEAKLQKPPSQNKAPAYSGKKFVFANYNIATNGDFFVTGQNKDDKGFKDVLTFHFDNTGKLKSQYSLDIQESNKLTLAIQADQLLLESNDHKSMFWLLREIRGITTWTTKPLTYPRIGKIDLTDGTISDFESYGKIEKDKFYLDPKFPYLQTDSGNKIVFFGSDKSGKNIWFCKVNLKK